jgi:hypothetical protein
MDEIKITKEDARYFQDKMTLDGLRESICTSMDLKLLNVLPENYEKWNNVKSLTNFDKFCETLKEEPEQDKEIIKIIYFKICDLIDYYMDLDVKSISIIALWIIGTYFHSEFISYPYLYFNAMRGSGKSRIMQLATILSKDGKMLNSMTEAVLFRTKGTLAIDEFESATSKELQALRELLNSGYKKGTSVIRMRRVKTPEGEVQQPEEFNVYRPIIIANITGLDQVLQDRCITIILEKSKKPEKVMLIEDFVHNPSVCLIKDLLSKCRLCMFSENKNLYQDWNNFVKSYTTTSTTYTTLHTLPTQNLHITKLFEKIMKKGIYGRNLEISLALMLISSEVDEKVLDLTLDTFEDLVKEKKHDEELESRDVMLIDYISKMDISLDFIKLSEFCIMFRNYTELTDKDESNEMIGRALKRLGLVIEKKRVAEGFKIIPNIAKAKEQIKMFR